MYCPKCNKENPDDAQFCNSCGSRLPENSPATEGVNIRVSKFAIASFVCALCGLICSLPAVIATIEYRILSPESDLVMVASGVSIIFTGAAIILGITALALIGSSGDRLTGYGFAAIGTAVPVILLFVICILPALRNTRSTAFRMVCGTNLSGIGKAMLIYANDYGDELPQAGGESSVWTAKIPDWKAGNRLGAYNLNSDGSGGQVSISSSFYLLVKYVEVTPKTFVCKQDSGTTEFKPAKYRVRDRKLIDLWDFGPEPWKHCSYSYHNPYAQYALTTSSEPGMAVAADRNPWMASPFVKAKRNFNKFNRKSQKEFQQIQSQWRQRISKYRQYRCPPGGRPKCVIPGQPRKL
jgi:hypothetical protein